MVAALSGISWALTILGLRWLGRGAKANESAGAAVVTGNLITFLVCLAPALPMGVAGPRDWMILVYLGVFQIGLAYILMTRGVRGVPALETSLLLLLEPVSNAVWAWLIHGERPGPWSLSGCAIILVATIARTFRRS